MLSNKKLLYIFIFLSIVFYSCSGKKEKPKTSVDYNDPKVVLEVAKKVIGNDVNFAYRGSFDNQNKIEIVAGKEITKSDTTGITFYLITQNDDGSFSVVYNTSLLSGSFNESLTKKIKFPGFNHELLYYNSQDYYLGSGGGEIFSYVIDFSKKQVYLAHLVVDKKGTNLFLSKNMDSPELRNFYTSYFKKDYPNLKLASYNVSFSD